jgi:2'-5' RNA ligase
MNPLFIGINFPDHVKKTLGRICGGLSFIQWTEEENFHLLIRNLGRPDFATFKDICEALSQVQIPPFNIKIEGLTPHQTKGARGELWANVVQTSDLKELKKEIDHALKPLSLEVIDRNFFPHVTLGKYDQLSKERFARYLMDFGSFSCPPFLIDHFAVYSVQMTPKKFFYKEEETFLLKGTKET